MYEESQQVAEMPQDEARRERWCLGSQWGVLTRRCTQGKAKGVMSLQRDPHHQERGGCTTDGEHEVSASWSVLSKTQDLRWAVIPATRESEVRGLKGQVLTQLQKVQNLKKKLGMCIYIYIHPYYI